MVHRGVWTLALFLGGCIELFPTVECSQDCSLLDAGPNSISGVRCIADDQCGECRGDLDCRTACGESGWCLPCSEEMPCRNLWACGDGVCFSCTSDEDCEPGEACVEGDCSAPCRSDQDCHAHYLELLGDWAAADRGSRFGCTLLEDFPGPKGSLFCSGSGYYPDSVYCDPCLAQAGGAPCPGCTSAGDCPCATTEDCPEDSTCRGGICGACRLDEECRPHQFCAEGRCETRCETDAHCPEGRCQLPRGACRQCLSSADCTGSERCYFDGCVEPCETDEDCPWSCCTEQGRCSGCGAPP